MPTLTPHARSPAPENVLLGLLSQQSILEGGRWLPVPDSRPW